MFKWTLRDIKEKVKQDFNLVNQDFVSEQELVSYVNEAIDIAESKIHTFNFCLLYTSPSPRD